MIDEAEARRLGISIEIFRHLARPREKTVIKNANPNPNTNTNTKDSSTVFNNVTPNPKVAWEPKNESIGERKTRYVIPKKSHVKSAPVHNIPPPRTPPGTPPSSRPSTPIPTDSDWQMFPNECNTIEKNSSISKKRTSKHKRDHEKDKHGNKIHKESKTKSHKRHKKSKLEVVNVET